jgi:uncharacterized protein (TIGR03790 family)
MRQILVAVGIITGCSVLAPVVHAQSAENVAVVINDASPTSRRIGEHYATTHALPASNVVRIQTTTDETIDRAEYVRTIEQPIGTAIRRAGLQDRVLYLVLTKGVPLRIAGTPGLKGTLASVDSELTLLYRRLVGRSVPVGGSVDNPYFLGNRKHDIVLVTRLDAFTEDEAIALIDRARAPLTEGRILLDQRGAQGVRTGEEWLGRAASHLVEQGHNERVMLETTEKAARDVGPVVGYASWGTIDPEQRVRRLSLGFVPGAIASNIASLDARTFREPPESWSPGTVGDPKGQFEESAEGLIGDLIRDGVTGVSGQVGEPFLLGAVRPDILFPAYLAGFNLVEAFYLATPTLSWQAVIIGDPLCRPFPRTALTRAEIEEGLDSATGLPRLFSRRRIAEVALGRELPERAVVARVRADTLSDQGDLPGARRALREAVDASPRVPDWLVVLAGLDDEAGDYDAAIQGYRRVLDLQPDHVFALNNLAYALAVHRKAPEEALPLAKRAVSLAPKTATLLDTLGWIEHLRGNDTVAVKVLADAIELDPTLADAHLHSAAVLAAMGVPERADSALKEALRLDPTLENEAQKVREMMRGRRGGAQ